MEIKTKKFNKKFDGELKWIDPKYLISETKYSRHESFFLGLGLVFNDLKGILLFEKMLIETYDRPNEDDVTVHMGNYAGVINQIQKIIASIISEFFIFLKKNNDVYTTNEFKEVLDRIPKSEKQFWDNLVLAAHGKYPKVDDFLKTIVQIRSNFTFHYDHSGKILRNSFISYFFGEKQNQASKYAYFSIDDSIDRTRFYFSDAVIRESILIAIGKKQKESLLDKDLYKKYQNQVKDTVIVMSNTIKSLIKNHIQLCRNKPH